MSDLLKPFYDWLMQRRRALLTELDEIERLLGISPTTAELRRREKDKNKEPVYVDVE